MRRSRWIAVFVAAVLLPFGLTCPNERLAAAGPPAVLTVSLVDVFQFGAGYYAQVELIVTTNPGDEVQAWDFDISWDPNVISWGYAIPHSDFDDDGALFLAPQLDAVTGSLRDLVDLRHGGAISGAVRVATLYLWSPLGGQSMIKATGSIAAPDGETFGLVANFPSIVFEP